MSRSRARSMANAPAPALPSSPHQHHAPAWRWRWRWLAAVATAALLLFDAVAAHRPADAALPHELSRLQAAVLEAPLPQAAALEAPPTAASPPTPDAPPHHVTAGATLDALNPLEELHNALQTMQQHYFALWLGIWPDAIDWTAAVMATFTSATLHSLTRSLDYVLPGSSNEAAAVEGMRVENEINKYFSHTTAYYYGEDAFGIRLQAYDDMLWVVLGWLESIRFINAHADLHYRSTATAGEEAWYGKQFEASFAHRAHIFHDIASDGWDTELCGGGMTWNPALTPYKNAITNQLFISASIGMYLYFPGDSNASPFVAGSSESQTSGIRPVHPHDPRYLRAAVRGYDWLRTSNMTNSQGLYVDGFHIRDWGHNGSIGTGKCDVRNEMVYTYNQGVILSGLRGLWEATGDIAYLEDGHELVRNVIAATGWHDRSPSTSTSTSPPSSPAAWAGLGRAGVLEDLCDAPATCSQDGQTFKGIFFHHLTAFCAPLPLHPLVPGKTVAADPATARLHAQSCKEYAPWVVRNARAARASRDREGRFGGWWGAGEAEGRGSAEDGGEPVLPRGAVDYRNNGTLPTDERWAPLEAVGVTGAETEAKTKFEGMGFDDLYARKTRRSWFEREEEPELGAEGKSERASVGDANDRGRGRTVETQGGGVAVLRAAWEFVNIYGRDGMD